MRLWKRQYVSRRFASGAGSYKYNQKGSGTMEVFSMIIWLFLILFKEIGNYLAILIIFMAVLSFMRGANKRIREREQNGQVELKINVGGWSLLVIAVILFFLSNWSQNARLY